MPYVWMDEIEGVDSIGPGGRTKVSYTNSELPNPELSEGDQVITTADGKYVLGEGGSGGGSSGGVLVVNSDQSTQTLDRTWQEIHDADYAVLHREVVSNGEEYKEFASLSNVGYGEGNYCVSFVGDAALEFICAAPDEYPAVATDPGPDPGPVA